MAVLRWVTDLARQAGAVDPDALARSLTLLLDGGLASGSVDARPDAPPVAKVRPGAGGHGHPRRRLNSASQRRRADVTRTTSEIRVVLDAPLTRAAQRRRRDCPCGPHAP